MIIKKDFLDKRFFNQIKNTITDLNFPWRMRTEMTKTDPLKDQVYFSYSFFNNLQTRSELYASLIIPILDKLKASSIVEARANLLISKLYTKSGWHIDNHLNCKTAILYLNTCNGGTELKNKMFVSAEENKLLLFDSSIEHRGISSTNASFRYILNINFFEDIYKKD